MYSKYVERFFDITALITVKGTEKAVILWLV